MNDVKSNGLIARLLDKSTWDYAQLSFTDRGMLLTDRVPKLEDDPNGNTLLVIELPGQHSPIDKSVTGTQTIVALAASISSITFFKKSAIVTS